MSALTRSVRDRSSSFIAGAVLAIALSTPTSAQCGDEVVLEYLDSDTTAPALITPKGAPVIGGDFSFRVFEGPPLSSGFLIYSAFDNPVYDPMFEATIWTTTPFFSKSFSTNVQGRSGPLFLTAVVTDDLCGAQATFQALVMGGSSPSGFAVSNAMRIRVGSVTRPLFAPQPLAADAPEQPGALALGDMDEDGIRDLVSVSSIGGTSTVWVRPGLAGGGFGAALKTVLTISGSSFLDVADFDEDGHLDLVRNASGGIALTFGDGDGGFTGEVSTALPAPVWKLDVADLNDDGDLDIAAIGTGDPTHPAIPHKSVFVLLGTGSGSFAFPVSYPASISSKQGAGADVEAADLDEDGDLDLVVAIALSTPSAGHDYKTAVLEGFGDGTFGSPTTYNEFSIPASPLNLLVNVALADFDGDTIPDVATTFEVNRRVYVRLSNGDLSLGPRQEYTVGDKPIEIAAADVDDDGIVDLIVSNWDSADLSVLLGNGDGSFASSRTFGMFVNPWEVAVTDVDFDGNQDLLLPADGNGFDPGQGGIFEVAGNGDGTFAAAERYLFARSVVVIADFDGDSVNDVLTGTKSPAGLLLHAHNVDGTFGPATTVSSLDVSSARAALVNGDAFIDLVVRKSTGAVSVLLGNGDGTFDPELNAFTPTGNHFALADIDGDQILDLAASRSTPGFDVALGNGDGTFAAPVTHATGSEVFAITVGDVDGDTIEDVVYLTDGKFEMSPGNGSGSFGAAQNLVPCCLNSAPYLFDIDGDGDLDIVSESSSELDRYTNDGTGTFALAQTVELPSSADELFFVDMDGDGDEDVVTSGFSSHGDVIPWEQPGVFGAATEFTLAVKVEAMAVGDLDRDGMPDIAVADDFVTKGRLSIHYNQVGE